MRGLTFILLALVASGIPVSLAANQAPSKPVVQIKVKAAPKVFVAATDNSAFKRLDATTIQFVKGNLLVSVKPPLKSATVRTPFGIVTVPTDSVVYVSLANGELQVQHLHGIKDSSLSAELKSGLFKEEVGKPLTIGVGQHMTGSIPVKKATKEAIPPLPTPVPQVSTVGQPILKVTGQAINSMAKNMPNPASRNRFAAVTKTPLIDDWVNDLDSNSVEDATGSDTTTSITSPNDVPSTDIAPADSFQTARENVQEGEFQPEAATQDGQDDSGLAEMFGRNEEGPDLDATGGMLEPAGSF